MFESQYEHFFLWIQYSILDYKGLYYLFIEFNHDITLCLLQSWRMELPYRLDNAGILKGIPRTYGTL